MKVDELALVQGWPETVTTLRRWRGAPRRRLAEWSLGSAVVAFALLAATWFVATRLPVDPNPYPFPGLTRPAHFSDFLYVVYRNCLVLGLHAMACVAGFIAGSPRYVEPGRHSRFFARLHRRAGHLAIAFVTGATLFSLATQAIALGAGARDLSARLGVSPFVLLATLAPHAVPELFALFLPLAAWIIASRRGAWNELLAATFATTAIALPIVVGAAAIETWITPDLLHGLLPG